MVAELQSELDINHYSELLMKEVLDNKEKAGLSAIKFLNVNSGLNPTYSLSSLLKISFVKGILYFLN